MPLGNEFAGNKIKESSQARTSSKISQAFVSLPQYRKPAIAGFSVTDAVGLPMREFVGRFSGVCTTCNSGTAVNSAAGRLLAALTCRRLPARDCGNGCTRVRSRT